MMWVFFLHYQQERVLYNSLCELSEHKMLQRHAEKMTAQDQIFTRHGSLYKEEIVNNASVVFLFAADFINWTFYFQQSLLVNITLIVVYQSV